jgi:hypothetical protein
VAFPTGRHDDQVDADETYRPAEIDLSNLQGSFHDFRWRLRNPASTAPNAPSHGENMVSFRNGIAVTG